MIRARLTPESLAKLNESLRSVPERVYKPLRTEFENWGVDWKKAMARRFTGTTGPDTLHSRSGTLLGGLHARVSGSSLDDLRLAMTSEGAIYARMQQKGGTVRPVNAQYLTIPVLANLYGSGNVRYPSALSLTEAFGEKRIVFFRSKKGSLLLGVRDVETGRQLKSGGFGAPKRNRKGKVAPFFVLKKEVKIPPRLGFFETWDKLSDERSRGLERVARVALGGRS